MAVGVGLDGGYMTLGSVAILTFVMWVVIPFLLCSGSSFPRSDILQSHRYPVLALTFVFTRLASPFSPLHLTFHPTLYFTFVLPSAFYPVFLTVGLYPFSCRSFAIGLGPVPFVIIPEVSPFHVRGPSGLSHYINVHTNIGCIGDIVRGAFHELCVPV